jgi:hypothetical protein
MIHGSTILRVGLAFVFGCFAVFQVLSPLVYATYLPHSMQGAASTNYVYLNAAFDAFLCLTILFSFLPRIAPLLGAAHLLSISFVMGWNDVAVRDAGLAVACLSLIFIHEEHIPTVARRVMSKLFNRH